MKKRMLHFVAWMLLVALMCSSMASAAVVRAEDFEVNPLFVASEKEDVLSLTDDMVQKDGTILVEGGIWERIIVYRTLKAEKIILKGVEAKVLAVESGKEYELELVDSKIGELVVAAPQTEELGVLAGAVAMQTGITTKGTTEIETVSVSSGAALNFAEGKVGNVEIETKDAYYLFFVDINNYNGAVAVELNNADISTYLELNLSGSELSELTITGEGRCRIIGNATVETMTVTGAARATVRVNAENVVLTEEAEGAKIKLYATVENLEVQADESKVALVQSAEVEEAIVAGDSVKIYGYGDLEHAEVTGKSANVYVFGAEVEGENDTSRPKEMEQLARPSSGSDSSTAPAPTAKPTAKPTAAPAPTGTPTDTPNPTGTPDDTPAEEVSTVTVTSPSGVTFQIGLDADGNMVTQKRYTADGTWLGSNIVSFDSEGRLVRVVCYDSEGNVIGKVRYEYDDTYWAEYIENGQTGVEAAVSLTVDSSGKATASFVTFEEGKGKINVYTYDGNLNEYGIVVYDEHGNMTSLIAYEADGTVITTQKYDNLYHDNGTLKQVTLYEDDEKISITIYDDQGNLVSEEYGFSGGYHYLNEYYANGELKHQEYTRPFYDYVSDEVGSYTYIYEYDEQGRITANEYYEYVNDVLVDYEIERVEYDSAGNLISRTFYDPDGNIIEKHTYEYTYYDSGELKQAIAKDTNGNIVEHYFYDDGIKFPVEFRGYDYSSEGVLESYRVILYDATMEEILEYTKYNADGSLIEKFVYEYYDDGTRKRETRYDINGMRTDATYDEQGNRIEQTNYYYDENGTFTGHYVSRYAVYGNRIYKISEISYNADGSVRREEFNDYYDDGTRKKSEWHVYEEGVEWQGQVVTYNTVGNILCYTYCYDGATDEKYEREYYEDNVSLKKETEYQYDDEGNVEGYSVTTYDTEGNETGYTEHDAEGNVLGSYSYQYTYYDNGYVKTKAIVDAEGSVTQKWAYEYHENGDIKQEEYYETVGIIYCSKYNEQGVEIEYTWYSYDDNTGALLDYHVYTYNDEGEVIKVITYDAEGNIEQRVEYEYYEDGITKKQVTCYDSEGEVTTYEKYNEEGIITERKEVNTAEDGTVTYVINLYDVEGNQTTSTKYDADDNVLYVTTYEYDEDGTRKGWTRRNAAGVVIGWRKYNEAGVAIENAIAQYIYNGNEEITGWILKVYYYDDDRNLLKHTETEYDNDGNAVSETITYDPDGNVITE